MTELLLIRHGKPAYPNGKRVCLGSRLDVPLCEEGFAQAAHLAQALRDAALERVYCSPLLRARQTAALLSPAPVILRELTEMDGGAWDGQTFEALNRHYPEYFGDDAPPDLTPPGGETNAAAQARGLRALALIAKECQGRAAVVTHAALIRALLSSMRDAAHAGDRFRLPYCAICTVSQAADGVWELHAADQTPAQWWKERSK